MRPPRPIGITILVILQILVGIFDLFIVALLLIVYAATFSFFGMTLSGLGIFLLPLVVVFLILDILSFILAFGLWTGKHWAWVSTVILSVIRIALGVVGAILGNYLDIVLIVLPVLMLAYLSTNGVRAFFGRVSYPRYFYGSTPPPYYQPRPSPSQPRLMARTMMCPNCLCPVSVTEAVCGRCGTHLR